MTVDGIRDESFLKCMTFVTAFVKKSLSKILLSSFAVLLDGCRSNQAHYVNTFPLFPSKASSGSTICLFGFSPFEEEDFPDAAFQKVMVEFVLLVRNRTLDNVVRLADDNCATNRAFADLLQKPLFGRACHGSNQAVGFILRKEII